jgi:riboflavin biosynthesis pyrimidine reductase
MLDWMSIPPADLSPFQVLFDHSELNPDMPGELREFAGNLGFPAAPPERPWIFANFVQSIDGMVTFGGQQPGGEWIARSRHDRWMMDLLRTHADALICGARSLELEARYGRFQGGPVYRIVDPGLLAYRAGSLRRGKLINIIVSGSGRLRPAEYRLFHSEHVEGWIATTPAGAARLQGAQGLRVLVCGERDQMDWQDLVGQLRRLGIAQLLCEGGPALYGGMMRAGLIDEKFLTIAPQEIGSEPPAGALTAGSGHEQAPRFTSFTGPGFSVENAQWYRLMSCRLAGDHLFLRYRTSSHPDSLPTPR